MQPAAEATTNQGVSLGGMGTIAMERAIDTAESIEDLIPEEIRKALSEQEKTEGSPTDIPEPKTTESTKQAQPAGEVSGEEDDEEEIGTDDSDISQEELAAILGEKNEKEATEETGPSWKAMERYKKVISKIGHTGLRDADLDEMIQEVVDAQVIEVAERNRKLDELAQKAVKTNEKLTTEISRLRNIEKGAFFDALDSTQSEFIKPLDNIKVAVKDMLQFEGSDISPNQLLAAKDKAAFTDLIGDIGFAEADLQKLTNLWRSHRELNAKYLISKKEAAKDLSRHLSTTLEDNQLTKVMQNALADLITHDDFSDIKMGIVEGIDKHKDVGEILTQAQTSFRNLGKALGNPTDAVNDPDFLQGLAQWIIRATRNEFKARESGGLAAKLAETQSQLKKLASAYKKISNSARGVEGKPKGNSSYKGNSNGKGESTEELLKEFHRIINTGEF